MNELEEAVSKTEKIFTDSVRMSGGEIYAHPMGQEMLERVLKNQLVILKTLSKLKIKLNF